MRVFKRFLRLRGAPLWVTMTTLLRQRVAPPRGPRPPGSPPLFQCTARRSSLSSWWRSAGSPMADIFQRLVELVEEAVQGIEFDLLVFELTLGFIRSGLLLRFIIGDPFQGPFGPGKCFFLDL